MLRDAQTLYVSDLPRFLRHLTSPSPHAHRRHRRRRHPSPTPPPHPVPHRYPHYLHLRREYNLL
jgi:hypothetical protein